jgi:hypothetical protein
MALLNFSGDPLIASDSRILEFRGRIDTQGLPVLSMQTQNGEELELSIFEECTTEGFPPANTKYLAHPLTPPNKSNFELLSILNGDSQAIPLTAEVSPLLGFSRTILYSNPQDPSRMYKLGGIGICRQEGNEIVVERPKSTSRMGKHIAGTKNMQARVFEPDGTFTHDENNTILGVYTTPGIVDKVQRHRSIGKILGANDISVPDQVLIAQEDNTDYYALGTSLPLSLNFTQLGNIEAWALSEELFRDPLLTLVGTFLRFNMLAAMHDSGLTHNQFTATNARINVTGNHSNTVIPNDFTDSRRLVVYPQDRFFKTALTPYPIDFKTLATLFDFEHSLHLVFKEVKGGKPSALSNHLMQLAGAAMAGYTNISMSLSGLERSSLAFSEQALKANIQSRKDIIKQAILSVFFPGFSPR